MRRTHTIIQRKDSNTSPTKTGNHLLATILEEIQCKQATSDPNYRFLCLQLLRFLESNGPASIFSNDSYEQVLYNALYRMLKRLKHFAEPVLLEKNL